MLVAALALAAAAPAAPELQPLQFLVGHCWRTALDDGPTDTHCFTKLPDGRVRDQHAVRKDGQVVYTGESLFSIVSGVIHYRYDGSTGAHLEGPMHAAGAKIVFDDVDKTGTETAWRQIDASHWEESTVAGPEAPTELAHFNEHKLYQLVSDQTP
jgi:hypothetical protein